MFMKLPFDQIKR